jgi:hypothetical protein
LVTRFGSLYTRRLIAPLVVPLVIPLVATLLAPNNRRALALIAAVIARVGTIRLRRGRTGSTQQVLLPNKPCTHKSASKYLGGLPRIIALQLDE